MSHSTSDFRDLWAVNVISYTKMRWKCVKARCGVAGAHKTIHLRIREKAIAETKVGTSSAQKKATNGERKNQSELTVCNAESGRNCRIRENRVGNAESGESNAEESQISVCNAKWGRVNAEWGRVNAE